MDTTSPYLRGAKLHDKDKRMRLAEWNHNKYLMQPQDIRKRIEYYPTTLIYTACVFKRAKAIFYATKNRWRYHEVWYNGDMSQFIAWLLDKWDLRSM